MKTMTKEKPKKDDGMSDRDLVSMMGMAMLDNGGLETIQQALQKSQDPVQVISQFMAQLIGSQAEYTAQNFGVNPAVYTEEGGFLDQLTDYVERKLKLPADMSDQVYGETLEVMKAAAAQPPQEQGGQPPAGGPPQAGPAPARPPMGLDQGVM
jgi:hypothetical protein